MTAFIIGRDFFDLVFDEIQGKQFLDLDVAVFFLIVMITFSLP